jgi:hypothetical protein
MSGYTKVDNWLFDEVMPKAKPNTFNGGMGQEVRPNKCEAATKDDGNQEPRNASGSHK